MIVHQAGGLTRPRAPARVGSAAARAPRVLGIASGKGGVGKSVVAVNLAAAASMAGARTLLVDGDAGLANADLLLGVVPRHDFADCVERGVPLHDALCAGPGGLELLVLGGGAAAVGALERCLAEPDGGALARCFAERPLALLDLGAGIGRGVVELARHCAPVWLVATAEPTSLADAYTTAKQLWERAPSLPLELVVNRARDRSEGERTHRILDRMTRRFLDRPLPLRAILPEDPALGRSVARQAPVVVAEPASPFARRIRLLADALLEERAAARA